MGRCSAMALAAARMAIADAGARRREARGAAHRGRPRHDDGRGASVLADLDHAWIAGGPQAVKRSLIPKVRLDAAPHPRRARHRRPGHGAHASGGVRGGQLRHRLRRRSHSRGPRRRRGHRRRGDDPGAPVQRLRAPRGDGAGEVPAVRPEPPGPHPRRGRGAARARERGARGPPRRAPPRRGRRLRPVVRRVPHHAAAPRRGGQHRRDAVAPSTARASRRTTSTS